jgi:predicted DsbA family dithiol-disulfide isomerase
MAERVRFYFEPRCPWCFQTSRWMRRLEELGDVDISWAAFSLAVVNKGDDARRRDDRDAAPALRTAVLLRERHGNRAVGRFYEALGSAIHEHGQPADDESVIIEALQAAGAGASIYHDAMADPRTWATVLQEHDSLVQEKEGFGVPTLVLDDGDGPAMFGPVLYQQPADDEARTLWQHVSWLMRNENFAELKRQRTRRPSFSVRADTRGDTARGARPAA